MADTSSTEASSKATPRLSIAIIGCGSLGTAILHGLLSSKESKLRLASIHATVASEQSADAVRKSLEQSSVNVHVYSGHNVSAANQSDVIILACPPDMMAKLLCEPGTREALQHKVLISVLAGVKRKNIEIAIYGEETNSQNAEGRCWVFRALPNLAVSMGASSTAIEVSDPEPPADKASLVNTIFEQLGGIVHVPASLMDASTVLCGSTPAFIALFMDGLIDGAVAAGVPRGKADAMAAQVLASTAALLKNGQRPSTLRESVCAMPGCTIQGNMILEEGGIRGVSAKAMKTAVDAACRLG